MGGKGSGYFGHSREHGLHRKGISTKIDEHRRFAVNNYVATGQLKPETMELRIFLESYKTGSEVSEQEPFDDNHAYRRFFRLMMDGSYKGENYYKMIQKRVEESNGNEKKLRSIAIQISMDMLETEFPTISRSTIQKNVVEVFGNDANRINDQLIDDLKDFAISHDMDWTKKNASGKIKYFGSQAREKIEDTDEKYKLVSKKGREVILYNPDTKEYESWDMNDDFAGYVIEIGGKGFEFAHTIPKHELFKVWSGRYSKIVRARDSMDARNKSGYKNIDQIDKLG